MNEFLGAFAIKLGKKLLPSFILSLPATSRELVNELSRNFILWGFAQICLHIPFSIKIGSQ
jgi:hypothetical protein